MRQLTCSVLIAGAMVTAAATPMALAASTGSDTPTGVTTAAAQDQSSEAAVPANLMTLMEKVGVGPTLDNLGIDLYGHVEGGYTYQFFQPNDTINGRRYDFISNRPLLNQAAINIERPLTVETNHFDVGFEVEALEGTDAGSTESFQSHTRPQISSDYLFDVGGDSFYQFDLPDAYVDFGIPLGRGVRVRVGRFEFFKPIDPNNRLFYSTTFAYTNAEPFTNTGVTVAYDFTNHAGIEAGFSRGYDVTVNDTNGSIDFIGKAHLKLANGAKLVATMSVGPELAHDSRDYSVLVDVGPSYTFLDGISTSLDAIYAHQFGDSTTSFAYNPFGNPTSTLPASYYGVSGTVGKQINSYFLLGARLEWFRDDGGLLTGPEDAVPGLVAPNVSRSLFEATIGTTVHPFPHDAIGENLLVRPEVRYDYSNRPFFGPTSGLFAGNGRYTRKDQLTFGFDVIYNF